MIPLKIAIIAGCGDVVSLMKEAEEKVLKHILQEKSIAISTMITADINTRSLWIM